MNPLIQALPDLVLLARRDGTVIECGGGFGPGGMKPPANPEGQSFDALWPGPGAQLLRQLTRKAIAARAPVETRFQDQGQGYELRVNAQGPDRVLCLIRPVLPAADDPLEATSERMRPQLDRRGFLRRFKDSVAQALLSERRLSLALIQIDGIADIGRMLSTDIAEQIMNAAILRLPGAVVQAAASPAAAPVVASPAVEWYLGQMGESQLALVLETDARDAVASQVAALCGSLRLPVGWDGAEFHLTPYAGIAVLGQDTSSARALLDHARAAAAEARRTASSAPCFFAPVLQLRSQARLDLSRELRDAIANRDIRLRYVARHDLATGRLAAWVGYLRWVHPLRGEIKPAQFLKVAETTGQAMPLSLAVLDCLRRDFAAHGAEWGADVRISFGALRHHLLHEDFARDLGAFLDEGGIPPERLELRIAEKSCLMRSPQDFEPLAARGVRLVVDEVGRELASFDWLARAPIWGLQLDRAWVAALHHDPAALKVCRAGIAVAAALDLVPLALGVDDERQRSALVAMGCRQGSGDRYVATFPQVPAGAI